MPISVVVGGQYGSEGKGKVALKIARSREAAMVVRVGGPNSGHTGVDEAGRSWVFRQLPAASLYEDAYVVLPAGSLIDPDLLEAEMAESDFDPRRLIIDSQASVVLERHRLSEQAEGLISRIGSTGSGTGASLRERISRSEDHLLAADHPFLRRFTQNFTPGVMRDCLDRGGRIVIEGTQGFGLSTWHGGHHPYATSRDTTAAGFVSESGLAPHDVDDVVLVIRSFPIRVGGQSGPLPNEIDWPTLASEARLPANHHELTSATRRIRRIARFDPDVVRRAIVVNAPHRIAMNHLDYIDSSSKWGQISPKCEEFVEATERNIGRKIDFIGTSPSELINRISESGDF